MSKEYLIDVLKEMEDNQITSENIRRRKEALDTISTLSLVSAGVSAVVAPSLAPLFIANVALDLTASRNLSKISNEVDTALDFGIGIPGDILSTVGTTGLTAIAIAEDPRKEFMDMVSKGQVTIENMSEKSSEVINKSIHRANSFLQSAEDIDKEDIQQLMQNSVDHARESVKAASDGVKDTFDMTETFVNNLSTDAKNSLIDVAHSILVGKDTKLGKDLEALSLIKEGLSDIVNYEGILSSPIENIGDWLYNKMSKEDRGSLDTLKEGASEVWGTVLDKFEELDRGFETFIAGRQEEEIKDKVKDGKIWIEEFTTKTGTEVKGHWRKMTKSFGDIIG